MNQLNTQSLNFAISSLAILMFGDIVSASDSPRSITPFYPGERLTYKLSWGPFSVGTAVMEVREFREQKDECVYNFAFFVKTSPFGDLFYKVRNRYTSLAELNLKRALYYTRRENENKKSRSVDVAFDWQARSAQYIREGVGRDPVPLPESALDPLSAIFAARLLEPEEGPQYSMNVTDGKIVGKVDIEIGKGHRQKTKAGSFDVRVVRLELGSIATVLGKKKSSFAEVWSSNDRHRVPVRMQGKAVWGTFRAELIKIERNALSLKNCWPSPFRGGARDRDGQQFSRLGVPSE